MLDMGDFAGGMLKYLRNHPVERVTIAGGFAKLTKLAQGAMDLHSGRSQVDLARLGRWAGALGADPRAVAACNTALQALELVGPALAQEVAQRARQVAAQAVAGAPIAIDTMVVSRDGVLLATAGPDETPPERP
jgi:cobalt-precorrin-5B (C1)-methyltransferase